MPENKLKGKLILVLDDNRAVLNLLQQALELEDCQVLTASNGLEGLNRLKTLQAEQAGVPDLIICDLMMPVMDGLQFSTYLADNPVYQAVPVVFITAFTHFGSLAKYKYAAIVYKPFDIIKILAVVRNLLNPVAPIGGGG